MYIVPRQGADSPLGTKFWCLQKHLVTSVICCWFQITDDNSFWKIHCFTFFPYKSIRDQIWPCRKIGQSQPRVIIWTLEHWMLHTKFQGHRPFGSREEKFFKVFTIYGHGGHLDQTFIPLSHGGSIWNLASNGPVVSEEKMFENADIHTYRWQRPTYTISWPMSLKAQVS